MCPLHFRGILLPCVDGHTQHKGNIAHINLLYHADSNKKFINNLNKLQKPIVQQMDDFLFNKPTQKKKILKNKQISVILLSTFNLDNINKIFPTKMLLWMKIFINHFNKLCPGFAADNNLVYAPAVEWNTYEIKVNEEMETNQKNLYIIGDGGGLTQGIIAAGVTGIIAARSIALKEKRGIPNNN